MQKCMFRPNETVNDLVNRLRNFDFPLVFSQSGCLILNITVRQMFSKALPIINMPRANEICIFMPKVYLYIFLADSR